MNLNHFRQEYPDNDFDIHTAAPNPFQQFDNWFTAAIEAEQMEPNAMTLATATPDGRPSARMVLLKDVDERGFVFYTNYTSRKADELAANPYAALVFYWDKLSRQVRVEGRVERVTSAESDTYFQSRPRGSQLGAWSSPQSQILPDRKTLADHLLETTARFTATNLIPRPSFWGGYRVVAEVIEFWQGRPNRLHDRLRYTRQADGTWHIDRLAP